MKREIIKKGAELLDEIDELSKYKNMLENMKHGSLVHFVIKQHYGSTTSNEQIIIKKEHTQRLLRVVDEIILSLNNELENLK